MLLLSVLSIYVTHATYLEEYSFLTTHNSYNYFAFDIDNLIVPNQPNNIADQLENGVRGFMLDNHDIDGEIRLCHGPLCNVDIVNKNTFVDVMNDDIISYLQENLDAIITIIIEDYIDDTALWINSLNQIIGIEKYVFNPFSNIWNRASNHWPTIKDMITNNQRLLIFTSKASNSGYFSVGGGSNNVYIMHQWVWTVENGYNIGDTIFSHDYTCTNRGESQALNAVKVTEAGFNWIPLFVMNHFHSVPEMSHAGIDNEFTHLLDRFMNYCYPESSKLPNYLSVDWYNKGDPLEFVSIINEGGFVFYEGNDGTQDVVCGVIGSHNHYVNMQDNNIGCENDEARSVNLTQVAKGTKLTIYDSPSRSKSDDFCEIYIKQDIGKFYENNQYIINSFEANIDNEYVLLNYFRNNGLDGKVSNVEILLNYNLNPIDRDYYNDAIIVLYEGNSASQNIVCTLHLGLDQNIDFQDNNECDNDEARSLIFNKAFKGTRIIIYDSPTQSTNDDYFVIDVINNIQTPYTINSFEQDINNNYLQATYYKVNGLDGKVSNIKISNDNDFWSNSQIILYEGNDATQDIVCTLPLSSYLQLNFKNDAWGCENDETRSLKITKAKGGTIITLYDSPDGKTDDDYYVIRILKDLPTPYIIPTYEKNINNEFIYATYGKHNGLDGKVSNIKIQPPTL